MNDPSIQTESLNQNKDKNKNRGRPSNSVWEDGIIKGESIGFGKFRATCSYCKTTWPRGEISKLEEHFASHCSEAPGLIVRKYITKVLEREDKSKKRKFVESNQLTITNYHDSTNIPDARITRINRALVKFFVACGISFRVVEHPFFINFVKELNSGYDPPIREFLSDQLLKRELVTVNANVNSIIENEANLTLGLLIYIYIYVYLFLN